MRRLRALIALPADERPISVTRLEQLAGLSQGESYTIAERGTMSPTTKMRYERAFTWVENDQVRVRRHGPRPSEIIIVDPNPPQQSVLSVALGKGGLELKRGFVNPRAFPPQLRKP